jgi:hypothetical protein
MYLMKNELLIINTAAYHVPWLYWRNIFLLTFRARWGRDVSVTLWNLHIPKKTPVVNEQRERGHQYLATREDV